MKYNIEDDTRYTIGDKAPADDINTPAHYHSGGIDVIGFSEKQFSKEQLIGSHRINVLKYVTRFDKKGRPMKDLKKARFYIDKLIDLERDSDEV